MVENSTTIVSTTDLDTGAPSKFTFSTIAGMFDNIRRSIESYDVEIAVTFDETLGYPTRIATNPSYGLSDGNVVVEVSELTLGSTVA
jgi:hypothetical protein